MKIPTITDYRVEEVEVPAPKEEQQIIHEALGLAAPALPPGPPRKMLKITSKRTSSRCLRYRLHCRSANRP